MMLPNAFMLFSKDASKAHRFRIWSICILIVVSASIVFVARVASNPSTPYISVKFGSTKFYGMPGISIEVSNKMLFNVNCSIEPETLRSGKWVSAASWSGNSVPWRIASSLTPHFKELIHVMQPQPFEGVRVRVLYNGRELKPIEISVFKKLPWLKKHYPFLRRRSFTFYPTASDFDVSQFKTYP